MRFTPPSRFLRLASVDRQGRAEVGYRKIYILPTGYGLGYALLLLLMLLGSINYANNLGFLLTFLLAGLGLVVMLHTWRNLLGLQLQQGKSDPVFAGERAVFEIRLINPHDREHPGITLRFAKGEESNGDIAASSSEGRKLTLDSHRRGRLQLPRLTLSTRFPSSLLQAWCYIDLPGECLVYPHPGPRLPPSGGADYLHSSEGDRGVGVDDFVGIRPYHNGDSPRHINWKALAREQALQTKQFGGDRAERRWLDWDEMDEEDIEKRLSRLCRGVLDACEQQLEFGLRLPSLEITPARGQKHRQACLTALALFGENQ
ncbi:MAG: DUF58 domain-containing protein [Candidatus Sedimenticola sp. (ex Thyasira tokunagai)]